MSKRDEGDEARIEELLRVNAELAAEVRSLSLGRREVPRPGPVPASRKQAKLPALEAELEEMRKQRDSLLAHKEAQEREIARLRSGFLGFLRRARSRLRR